MASLKEKSKKKDVSKSVSSSQNGAKNFPRSKNQNKIKSKVTEADDDVWVCKYCTQEFSDDNDKLMTCDRCDLHVCLTCTNGSVSLEMYDYFSQDSCTSQWFCRECFLHAKTAVKEDRKIEVQCQKFCDEFRQDVNSKFRELEGRFSSLEIELNNKFAALDKAVNDLTNANKNLQLPQEMKDSVIEIEQKIKSFSEAVKTSTTDKTDKDMIRDSANEVNERAKRKSNLIWFGIPESDAEAAEDRIKYDSEQVESVLNSVFDIDDEDLFSKTRRLGKKKDDAKNPRPIITTFESSETVNFILRNGRKLGSDENVDHKGVSVKKDMTPLERENHKKLLAIRDQKRAETKQKGTEEIWAIRGSRVVDVTKKKK